MTSCGKRRYDRLGAMLALAKAQGRNRDETRMYRCPECRAYHLTSRS